MYKLRFLKIITVACNSRLVNFYDQGTDQAQSNFYVSFTFQSFEEG